MRNNIRKIRRELEQTTEQNEGNNIITEPQLIEAIEKHAGMSNRTIRRYKNKMMQKQIIKKDERLSTADTDKYRVERRLAQDQKKEINHAADKKDVHLTVNSDLINKLDLLGVNKSEFFEKKAKQEYSKIDERIEDYATALDEPEYSDFLKDMILEEAYLKGKNDDKRKELWKKHFDSRYNEFACEDLRKKAVKIAEKLGIQEKPEGL